MELGEKRKNETGLHVLDNWSAVDPVVDTCGYEEVDEDGGEYVVDGPDVLALSQQHTQNRLSRLELLARKSPKQQHQYMIF